ncbi:hypothetical protein [Bacteroides xylanisolvens]|uniref:hypothetical protein n=1 Tax=Bacteroides xylanisolvens TaxID=371601 RepID=UPI001CDD4DDB|nr:hypothetical protein [Bacteroides xylanisolvens]MCA4468156.1 hypothetical protein [Bacteroides xylanisolvens]MCA4472598.1 hypothetical protein [Bacteroides xylanisolvens]MCA4481748.1 hypothetical protein [Bacteroides xylanisolvens]MCA4521573.1 hypothetical protein [Bacteroides xylanisolvens]MCA4558137.1 hypothetical protein [Bacteroides xylanisolvens]
MKNQFELNQKVTVFDQEGIITEIIDVTREPHLYAVTFDTTGKKYVIEAEHIEAAVDNRPITERVKTLEDAIAVLGEDHTLVRQYHLYEQQMNGNEDDMRDLTAFLKLRIITAALNQGWSPDWTNSDEWKYYPWFCLYTEDEYNDLDADDKERCCRVVGRSYVDANANGGLVCADASIASSYSGASYGSRLAFKTRELALYAGKQFVDLWCDFVF